MKFTSITTTLVHIPYEAGAPTKLAGQSWSRMAILLVRVDTDEGVTGWGEGLATRSHPPPRRPSTPWWRRISSAARRATWKP